MAGAGKDRAYLQVGTGAQNQYVTELALRNCETILN